MADLENYHKFAKISSAKIPCLILNNIIIIHIPKGLAMSPKLMCFVVNLLKFTPIKVFLYTEYFKHVCAYTHMY